MSPALESNPKMSTHLRGHFRVADLRGADLSGADFSGSYLRGAYLSGADLSGADFRRAYFRGADLRGADLRGASLCGADLQKSDLRGADLSGADLSTSNLRGADLRGANIFTADFSRAVIYNAAFTNLIVKQGPIRSDGCQYILYTSALGGCVIKTGRETWWSCEEADAFEKARHHSRINAKKYAAEALRIIDFLKSEFELIWPDYFYA